MTIGAKKNSVAQPSNFKHNLDFRRPITSREVCFLAVPTGAVAGFKLFELKPNLLMNSALMAQGHRLPESRKALAFTLFIVTSAQFLFEIREE